MEKIKDLVNAIQSLGLEKIKAKGFRTCINAFRDPTNGDEFRTYSTGYVRRLFYTKSQFRQFPETLYAYQLNKVDKQVCRRILLKTEEERLLRLYEVLKIRKSR